MSDTVISVKDVSKKYRLFDSPKERLIEALHPLRKRYHKEFWALRNISFDVSRGQTLGILGRNGSGKSTLLQLIAGILQPTSGQIMVNGRVSALLELGTGFNPEFTGRDNVMLSGGIMGISRKEMLSRVPEIESFADIGEFFDQPVKTYSSGMNARLGFAAAINVDPDILIVDEALAVGDVRFQEKCYARMRQFRKKGKTILFVSHSIDAITTFCHRALIIEQRQVHADGEPKEIVDKYLRMMLSKPATGLAGGLNRASSGPAQSPNPSNTDRIFGVASNKDTCPSRRFYNDGEVRIVNGGAAIIDYLITAPATDDGVPIPSGAEISLYVKVFYERTVSAPIIGFELKTVSGISISGNNTFLARTHVAAAQQGEIRLYRFEFRLPVNGGDYFVDLGVAEYDGSPGGYVLELRRSIIHLVVAHPIDHEFCGLIDLAAEFSEVSSSNLAMGATVRDEP